MTGFIRSKTKIEIELNHDKKNNEALKETLKEIGDSLTVEELKLLAKAVKDKEIKTTAINYLKLI